MSLFQYSLNDIITLATSKLTDLAMPIVYGKNWDRISYVLLNLFIYFLIFFFFLLYKCRYKGLIPDFLLRLGIRYRLQHQLIDLRAKDCESEMENKMATIEARKTNPTIAIATDEANEQHCK